MKSKGQSFMPDFLASLAIFGVITAVFLFSWNSVVSNQNDFDSSETLRKEAYYTTAFLVTTPGYPHDWNSSNVNIPGFANSDNVISGEKLEEFRELDYREQKLLLQAPEYYLKFYNSTALYELNGEKLEFGEKPENASDIAVVNRDVIMNLSERKTGKMKYIAWR